MEGASNSNSTAQKQPYQNKDNKLSFLKYCAHVTSSATIVLLIAFSTLLLPLVSLLFLSLSEQLGGE